MNVENENFFIYFKIDGDTNWVYRHVCRISISIIYFHLFPDYVCVLDLCITKYSSVLFEPWKSFCKFVFISIDILSAPYAPF